MSTLILRLAAPMQSWGADSKYNYRKTNREPTKSGVIGLLAAALGCRRDDTGCFARLSKLRFGVRADREGTVLRDFHMAHGNKNSKIWTYGDYIRSNRKNEESTLTYRDYLCDAVFVVGLEGERAELEKLEAALHRPVYPLSLGRRSCPPTGPVCLGIRDCTLEEALRCEPWQGGRSWQRDTEPVHRLRAVLDAESGFTQLQDVPVSFSPLRREYRYRNIEELWVELPGVGATEHDPMAEL